MQSIMNSLETHAINTRYSTLHVFMFNTSRVYVQHFTFLCSTLHVFMLNTSRGYVQHFTCLCSALHVFMFNTSRVYVQYFMCLCSTLHAVMFYTSRVILLKYNINITAFICVFKVCLIETDVLTG